MSKAYDGPPRVLVGYDGSDDAQTALAYGVSEAKARDAELVLAYAVDDVVLNTAWTAVVDQDEIKREAREMLDAAAAEIIAQGFPRRRVHAEVVLGAPVKALSRLSEWATIVVVGRTSNSGEQAVVGSTAVGVAAMSRCPVVVMGVDTPIPDATHRIGVGVNPSARTAANALSWAFEETIRTGSSLTVLSVCKPVSGRFFRSSANPEQQEQLVADTRAHVSALVAAAREGRAEVKAELEVILGSPVDTLVRRSAELDLLVVDLMASFPTYAVSGVARGVMTHARCPVALLRS